MFTQNKTNVSPEIRRELLNEVYIEKIDDVLAEYAALFSRYPSMKHDETLSDYYKTLSLLVRNIRFGLSSYKQQDIETYLRQAHAAKVKAEVFA